jgi:hypothetical protein
MVELTLECVEGKHPFVAMFPNPVDWGAVNAAVKDLAPRCPEHPDRTLYWYDE